MYLQGTIKDLGSLPRGSDHCLLRRQQYLEHTSKAAQGRLLESPQRRQGCQLPVLPGFPQSLPPDDFAVNFRVSLSLNLKALAHLSLCLSESLSLWVSGLLLFPSILPEALGSRAVEAGGSGNRTVSGSHQGQ